VIRDLLGRCLTSAQLHFRPIWAAAGRVGGPRGSAAAAYTLRDWVLDVLYIRAGTPYADALKFYYCSQLNFSRIKEIILKFSCCHYRKFPNIGPSTVKLLPYPLRQIHLRTR
jgi:hypothetical protein